MDRGDGQGGRWFSPLMVAVIAVIILAGMLFGYDQGVISGALAGIQKTFHLGPRLLEMITSWVTLGALLGSLMGGELADRVGRKKAVLTAGALFTIGSLTQALAPHPLLLVGGRLVIGLGVGLAAVAAPLYGAEMAPSAWRGRFVSAYQLAITIGIFLAYEVDAVLTTGNGGSWRLMLGVCAFAGIALFVAMLIAPESPRWLLKMGRREEAAARFGAVQPGVDFRPQFAAMEAALREDSHKASWGEVFDRQWRRPLMVAVGLAIYQQITGINAIIYYADSIFAAAGFASPAAQTTATTWAIGAVNVAATLIAIVYIDRLGRRPLLLAGLIGMGGSLVAVGIAFLTLIGSASHGGSSVSGIVTLIGLIVFIISFAFSLGPVVWTVINEIFPGRVRGRAVAVATAVNWGAAFIVSRFFLTLVNAIGQPGTFWLFAFFCLTGWIWIWRRVPETSRRSLEQIEQFWIEQASLAPLPGRG